MPSHPQSLLLSPDVFVRPYKTDDLGELMHEVEQKIQEWILDAMTGQQIQERYKLLRSLEAELFSKYEPQSGPRPDFWQRFTSWIANVGDDDDKKRLLLLASHIFFVGREEFETLYLVAYNNIL